MLVLGLIDSKPSAAALVSDEKILVAIAEERICRMKMATGMPRDAINWVMEYAGVSPSDLDGVAVAQKSLRFEPTPQPWSGWFEDDEAGEMTTKKIVSRMGASLAPVVGSNPLAWQAHHTLKSLLSRDRLQKLPELLRTEYQINAPVKFYDHHYCHATSAYYTSNFDKALVVTLDGGGDGRSGSVYVGENGRLRPIASVDSYNSLGNFYSYITALCGFKAEKHEGKVTGLAALGEPEYADILRDFFRYNVVGEIRYAIPMYHRSALQRIAERLPKNFDRANLAASVQLILEEQGIAFIRHWLRETGLRKIAVAGGVFANVKFNQRVHELDEVDEIFIHPAMDDSGLSVGGGYAFLAEQPNINPAKMIHRLPNVYLGPDYDDERIKAAIRTAGVEAVYTPNIHQKIAELIANGDVVARCTGRMEYGPRALGHRSIMYQTTDPAVNDWLNINLKRTEFMPFAPATLASEAHRCYINFEGAEDPARFMTITFDCTDEMKRQSPGVVHVDGTARPQIIDEETAPDFHKILTAYYKLTGIPSLINTSFNMHEEPIVCTPEDAIRSFQQGNLDHLALGDWLLTNKEAIAARKQANAQSAVK